MADIDPLLRRNRDFAATGVHETAGIVANFPVYVITCLDPRTDPSAFLELELGDAMVIRNATPAHPALRLSQREHLSSKATPGSYLAFAS
jgi:carbonic anhydrase